MRQPAFRSFSGGSRKAYGTKSQSDLSILSSGTAHRWRAPCAGADVENRDRHSAVVSDFGEASSPSAASAPVTLSAAFKSGRRHAMPPVSNAFRENFSSQHMQLESLNVARWMIGRAASVDYVIAAAKISPPQQRICGHVFKSTWLQDDPSLTLYDCRIPMAYSNYSVHSRRLDEPSYHTP
jgi:hypothetical protein